MMVLFQQTRFLAFFVLFLSHFAFADAVWIDVRSAEEYAENHIDGDINLDFNVIADEIGKHVPDKDTEIHVYCRSGRRSEIALGHLNSLGYKNVTNEGGIEDARKKRAAPSAPENSPLP